MDRAGGFAGHQHIAAPHDGCIGDRQGIFGFRHHDLCVGIHARAQAVGLIDAYSHRVGGGAAAGIALHGHAGDHAFVGLVRHGVGGHLDRLPHGQAADLQFIHIDGHLQIAQIIDGAQIAAGAQGVAGLGALLNDGSADGRSNGVVVHGVLQVFHGKLCAPQGLGGGLDGFTQVIAADLQNDVILVDGTALPHIDGGNRASGQGGQGALGLVLEGCRANGADAVDGSSSRLGRGQAAGVLHRDGHGAGEQVAGAQGIGTGHGSHGAVQGLKGAVQGHLCVLPHREGSRIRRREIQRQGHFGAVPDDRHFLAAGHFIALGDLQCADGAGHFGAHILTIHRLVITALSLLQGDGCLLHLGGGIGRVHGVQHGALFHHIALFNGAGEHFAGHQRLDAVGVGRLQGAGAAQGVGQVPGLGGRFHIAGVHVRGLGVLGLGQPPATQRRHAHHRHQPFPVLLEECRRAALGSGRCTASLRVSGRRWFLFPVHARFFPPKGCQASGLHLGSVFPVLSRETGVLL